jgi:crossover junction endodeoxyribonuclease RuvC
MGIDPGLASTGVAALSIDAAGRMRALGWRQVTSSPKHPMPERLARIHGLVTEAIAEWSPSLVAVESIFFAKNVRSAVLMAHGRGAAILAAATSGVELAEFAPREIKRAVTGSGAASKEKIRAFVALLLELREGPRSDHESDAMAAAICGAMRGQVAARMAEARASTRAAGPAEDDPRKALLARAVRRRR